MVVEEVAPHPISAVPILVVGGALLGFVLRVLVLVLPQLIDAMGELALETVVTGSIFHEVPAELVLEFLVATLPPTSRG